MASQVYLAKFNKDANDSTAYYLDKVEELFKENNKLKFDFNFKSGISSKRGLLTFKFTSDNMEEDILITFDFDFKNKKLFINTPVIYYKFFNDYANKSLPTINVTDIYTLSIEFHVDNIQVQILDKNNKVIFNQTYSSLLLKSIFDNYKNIKLQIFGNTFDIDAFLRYKKAVETNEDLSEEYLYSFDLIDNPDYLGVVPFDETTKLLSKDEDLVKAITVTTDQNDLTFQYYKSNYAYRKGLKVSRGHKTIIDIDFSKLKTDSGYKYSKLELLFIYQNNSGARSNFYINGQNIGSKLKGISASSFTMLKLVVDKENKALSIYQIVYNVDKRFIENNVPFSRNINLVFQIPIENEQVEITLKHDLNYSNDYDTNYGLYLFKNFKTKYLTKIWYNIVWPAFDADLYDSQFTFLDYKY